MVQSMTGFGKATLQLPTKKITVEIKSLNSKGLDLSVRLPPAYREMELELRNEVSQRLERGKIDFCIYVENTTELTASKVNAAVVRAYIGQMKEVIAHADEIELMKMAIRMPDAMKTDREEIDETEWAKIQITIGQALDHIQRFRWDEGAALEKEFRLRVDNIRSFMEAAYQMDPDRIKLIKDRLHHAVSELKTEIDQNRFEQELIYYLEKFDITEEKVRLGNHLDYFLDTLSVQETNGRKLGFITQEMGREINTMGSKSNHSKMQKLVVLMKDELEKIKEQVLNVL